MAEHKARWSMSLDCTCPKCGHYFDLLQADEDFFCRGSGLTGDDFHGTVYFHIGDDNYATAEY